MDQEPDDSTVYDEASLSEEDMALKGQALGRLTKVSLFFFA